MKDITYNQNYNSYPEILMFIQRKIIEWKVLAAMAQQEHVKFWCFISHTAVFFIYRFKYVHIYHFS